MQDTNPTRWVTAEALKALAAARKAAGDIFGALELADWTAGTLSHEQRVHASSRLCALGFIKHSPQVVEGERVDVYTVTLEGAAAIEAAGAGKVRKSGPKSTRGPDTPDPRAFSSRLWALMRVRRMLTPGEAADTLCDAGDGDHDKRRATARKCLRRWCNAGALAESARRVGGQGTSNGEKRYVLTVDTVAPPRWRKPGPDVRQAAATEPRGATQ